MYPSNSTYDLLTTSLFEIDHSRAFYIGLRSFPRPISMRADAIATAIGCAPSPQTWPRIIVEDDSAARMFAATKPRPLNRITKKRYSVFNNCSHRRGEGRPMPTGPFSFAIKFLYEIRFAADTIDQPNIGGSWNVVCQNSLRHSPDCATHGFCLFEIGFRDSYSSELQRAQ